MKKTAETPAGDGAGQEALAPVETRTIPNPPGGGSWTWDPVEWKWNSNDPVVQPAATQE